MLSNLAACAELFHTADGTAFADLTIDGHWETWPIRSIRLRSWLRRKYYEATGAAATAGAISSALDLLEARAQFDAPQRAVYLRVAEHDLTQLRKVILTGSLPQYGAGAFNSAGWSSEIHSQGV